MRWRRTILFDQQVASGCWSKQHMSAECRVPGGLCACREHTLRQGRDGRAIVASDDSLGCGRLGRRRRRVGVAGDPVCNPPLPDLLRVELVRPLNARRVELRSRVERNVLVRLPPTIWIVMPWSIARFILLRVVLGAERFRLRAGPRKTWNERRPRRRTRSSSRGVGRR
jgi:hypothetical protein